MNALDLVLGVIVGACAISVGALIVGPWLETTTESHRRRRSRGRRRS